MPGLCDVNVLLALTTDRHASHAAVLRWAESLSSAEAAICRIAQAGLLRLLNNPSVMREDALDTDSCWQLWHRMLRDERLYFTPTEPPGLDAAFERFTTGKKFTPRLWTDAYLAAYAQASGLTLVTFDQGFRQFPDLICQILDE